MNTWQCFQNVFFASHQTDKSIKQKEKEVGGAGRNEGGNH